MTKNDIVATAIKFKEIYKTNNPFEIAKILNINCNFVSFRKNAVQAYILKPYEDIPPCIFINSNFNERSQKIFCAHELGHAVLHKNAANHFDGDSLSNSNEYEANLFAVALLFDSNLFKLHIESMDNYILKYILDFNVNYS